MRKRSCAIHSDSAEHFLQLSEEALQKTGLFYNQVLNPEDQVAQQLPQHLPNQYKKLSKFSQFDFNEQTQMEEDQKSLISQIHKMGTRTVKNVIICDQVEKIAQTFSTWNEGSEPLQSREIDLIIRKYTNQSNSSIIIKYWIIDSSAVHSPLIQVYLKQAANLYSLTKTDVEMLNSVKCSSLLHLSARILQDQQKEIRA